MSLHFSYQHVKMRKPVWSLGGQWFRPRPLVTVSIVDPTGTVPFLGMLDTGADDTVFPDAAAIRAGIDLTNAPIGEAGTAGGGVVPVLYAEVALRITDGYEFREWKARVGFTSASLSRPLLGFAGFLQFFSSHFHGDREEVELTVNSLYSGT